jgi:hypothetical protein
MKSALIRTALVALMPLTSGCVMSPEGRDDYYDTSTRASDEMAPANPNRGSKTMRVTTRTPPELNVRLVTFYSQFHPPQGQPLRSVSRSDKPADGCWWSRTSLLQEERFYYTRVFYYPVSHGTHTQNLVLDEVVPGMCHLGITGVGYEVALREPKGESVIRYLQRFDIAVEEGGAEYGNATIRCSLNPVQTGKKRALRCEREGKRSNAYYVGPLSTSGAALTLEFRLEDAASN